ncbi:hypothetical protein D6_00389 [Faustovirus]|nr:hypothetical protein D6_00389 [Faustovirus]AMP44079.1 hypothetical protein PRJ_Dakar_00120 [Faustovirus]
MQNPRYPRLNRVCEQFIADFMIAMRGVYRVIRMIFLITITLALIYMVVRMRSDLRCDRWASWPFYNYDRATCESLENIAFYIMDTAKWLYDR